MHAKADQDYQKVLDGVSKHRELNQLPRDHPAQSYSSYWDALAVEPELPGLILYHGRIVVPATAKEEILKTLHVQHTKETKTLANARQLYFWPGMTKDIKLMVSQCQQCIPLLPSQRLEEQIQTVASRPFEAVSVDLGYYKGTHYLVLVDRYSGWPLV